MNERKEQLLMSIDGNRAFRYQKANGYPDDTRNKQCAEALEELYPYIESLPDDHELFKVMDATIEALGDNLEMLVQEESNFISRWGFDGPVKPEEFVPEMITLYKEEAGENGNKGGKVIPLHR